MKKCVIISNYVNNQYRKSLLKEKIQLFNSHNIDVILASSDHIDKYDGVKNYITNSHVCDSTYLSSGQYPYFIAHNVKFMRNINNRRILYSNYFIKLYQTTLNYCKNLGYEFCYFIDLDVLLNKNHLDYIFNQVDTNKAYFYTLGVERSYQVTFFYGNLNVLTSFFTQDKLDHVEQLVKTQEFILNEQIVYLLSNNHKDVVGLNHSEDDVFERRNLFSVNNQAEIFYDKINNRYLFLCAKGDVCKNMFGVELFEENTLIHTNTFCDYGSFYFTSLKNDKNYTIKYYDAEISENTLSKITNVFTDSSKSATPNNWVQYIN